MNSPRLHNANQERPVRGPSCSRSREVVRSREITASSLLSFLPCRLLAPSSYPCSARTPCWYQVRAPAQGPAQVPERERAVVREPAPEQAPCSRYRRRAPEQKQQQQITTCSLLFPYEGQICK